MAYFSNGSEGMAYEEQWCARCIHNVECAVWDAHLLHNGGDADAKSVLDMLIPRTLDGLGNERCLMFLDETLLSPLAREKYRGETA